MTHWDEAVRGQMENVGRPVPRVSVFSPSWQGRLAAQFRIADVMRASMPPSVFQQSVGLSKIAQASMSPSVFQQSVGLSKIAQASMSPSVFQQSVGLSKIAQASMSPSVFQQSVGLSKIAQGAVPPILFQQSAGLGMLARTLQASPFSEGMSWPGMAVPRAARESTGRHPGRAELGDLLDEDGFFHLDERDILASRDVDRFTAEDLERAERLFAAWVTAVHCTVVYCVTAVGQDHATLGTAINAGIQLLGPPGAIWVYLQTLNFVRKAREDGGITPWW